MTMTGREPLAAAKAAPTDWSASDLETLRDGLKHGAPLAATAAVLGRSPEAVALKIAELGAPRGRAAAARRGRGPARGGLRNTTRS